jgi:hypothetical protein
LASEGSRYIRVIAFIAKMSGAKPKAGAAVAAKKKPAAAATKPKSLSSKKKADWKSSHKHLFEKDARDFRIGRDLQPKRDLSRFLSGPDTFVFNDNVLFSRSV